MTLKKREFTPESGSVDTYAPGFEPLVLGLEGLRVASGMAEVTKSWSHAVPYRRRLSFKRQTGSIGRPSTSHSCVTLIHPRKRQLFLVDLSAVLDTVNHRRLLEKIYNMTRDYRPVCLIRMHSTGEPW